MPPAPGGLGDHTSNLAATLAQHREVQVLTSSGAAPDPRFEVRAVVADWHDAASVEAAVAACSPGAALLWQYVPHMYGRGGVNRAVPTLVERFRRQGRRQVLIAHEIMAPLHWKPHWLAYALWHRWAWKRIRRSVDAVGVSTEGWIRHWSSHWADVPGGDVFLLPSPSNFPVVPVPQDHRARWKSELGLPPETTVLAYFGTLNAAKQPDWVFAAWRAARGAGIPTALAVIGGKPSPVLSPEEKPFYRPLGFLDAASVSRALQAVDLLLLPFSDGVAERRTTITAGLAHGTPILTTVGPSTGATLRAARFLRAVDAADPRAFQQEAVRLLASAPERLGISHLATEAYRDAYSWDVVASRLLARLP
jgi:glycosyltransferase involved in cell wall biosynthesis